MLLPVAPSGKPQPMKTSSISPGSIPARAIACLTVWPAITAPWVWLKPPRTDFARPVRAVETMTACLMRASFRAGANLAVQAFGCQSRIAQCEGQGQAQGDHADGDTRVKRKSRIDRHRPV